MSEKTQQRICLAIDCDAEGAGTFHKFPKDAELRKKWLENLGLTEKSLSTKSRPLICRRHFTKECFGKKRIYPWAVPTLFLGKTEGLHQTAASKLSRRKCCIRSCQTKSSEILHAFPKNIETRKKWMEICGLMNIDKTVYICHRHFRPSFIHRQKLLAKAVPELHLDQEEDDPLEDGVSTDCSIGLEDGNDSEAEDGENTNCRQCTTRETQCLELQQQVDALRLKVTQLEQQLQQNTHNDEEEYIFLLLK